MKSLTIIYFILFAMSIANAQGCLPEGITFETQAQIDSFHIIYPGCTVIEGDVSIVSQYPHTLTNLNGLSQLTSIGGSLSIEYTYNLHNLSGLNALISIGGGLTIDWNDGLSSLAGLENLSSLAGDLLIGSNIYLTNLAGLGNLASVGGSLNIWYNSSLTSLTGLENLATIGGSIDINNNDALTSLSGLDNVISIGGSLSIWSNGLLISLSGLDNINSGSITNLSVYLNSSLSACEVESICDYLSSPNGKVAIYSNAPGCDNPSEVAEGCGISLSCLPYGNYYFYNQTAVDNFKENFPGCTELEGNVNIKGDDIINLTGLNEVTSIEGNLEISWNNALTTLAGLESLNHIGGGLSLYYLDSLTSLTGLGSLISLGDYLRIYYSSSLVSLSGLESLQNIGGDCCIYNNYLLSSLTGTESLSSVGGSLILGYCDWENGGSNPLLNNLTGLENLVSIGKDLSIVLTSLHDLTGLNNLTSIGSNLVISSNNDLVNLMGFDNLTSIGGNFEIGKLFTWGCLGNYSLTSLTGVEALNSIGGNLYIQYDALTDLNGLDALTSIGGDVVIQYNDSISSIKALDNLDAGSIINLTIRNNLLLSDCETQSICDYLSAPNGTVEIHDNAPGCSSQEEVEAACSVGIDNPSVQSSKFKVQSYPNPTDGIVNFQFTVYNLGSINLKIYNAQGQEVAVMLEENMAAGEHTVQWDAGKLPAGIYYCRLTTDDYRLTTCGKIVKY